MTDRCHPTQTAGPSLGEESGPAPSAAPAPTGAGPVRQAGARFPDAPATQGIFASLDLRRRLVLAGWLLVLAAVLVPWLVEVAARLT